MAEIIGLLSPGEMGLGVAQLLQFNGYKVVTNVAERSQATRNRASRYNIECLGSDIALVQQSEYILSIVPPRDAIATASRLKSAAESLGSNLKKKIHFLDLNAVSPKTSQETYDLLADSANVILYDGVISGGVPHPTMRDTSGNATAWHCPTLLMSGPHNFSLVDEKLSKVINIEYMSDTIGAAVATKMCFGMMTKGYITLAIQAFTTAERFGVVEDLERFLGKYKPQHLKIAQEGLVRMPHTAYRWVFEMLEMAETTEAAGFPKTLFEGVADTYRIVAEDTVLGTELPDKRVRGQTVKDVVECITEGLDRKRKLTNGSEISDAGVKKQKT